METLERGSHGLLPRNLHAEKSGDAFIKFELRVSEVASLAKKPVMLTVMLINIT